VTLNTSNYPRPDFVRTDWNSLDGEWDFSLDTDILDKKINVPFAYQCVLSGIGITEDHQCVWYRRTFSVDWEILAQKRLLLKFGAVDYEARVFINGAFAGSHLGGNTSFELDITAFVHPGENEVKLQALDGLETDKPRGKQSWTGEPFGCWYTPTTGIWQSVWLEYVGDTYLKRVKITPKLDENLAICEVFLSDNSSCAISVEAFSDSVRTPQQLYLGKQQFTCNNGYGKCVIAFPDMDHSRDRYIWFPDAPNLIYVNVEVASENGSTDKVTTYFGMRSIQVINGQFYLNGQLLYQRLVLDQGYWPDSLLTPPNTQAIIDDIRLTKEMGFNGARKHQKVEDPRYYYWADKMGLLVWGELPSCYMFNDNTVKKATREMTEFVERDYNHPCIVTWVPMNESWGVRNVLTDTQQQAFCDALLFLVKALDPTRPVSGNDGWEQTDRTDIMTLHDYALMPSSLHRYEDIHSILNGCAESRSTLAKGHHYQGQPIVMSEYGGVAYDNHGEGWGYYNAAHTEQEFLERITPITEYLIKSGKFAGFCYTQLTDVMQEKNGLLDAQRRPKVATEKLRAVFAKRYFED